MGNHMDKIELIESYIVFLVTECGLSISLHPQDDETLITFSRLMRFNLHDNSYCTYIKSDPEGRARCLEQQRRVHRKCTETKESFCGICHAGVYEYVYPIFKGDRVTGFISVSGYKCDDGIRRLDAAVNALGYSEETLLRCYSSLRPSGTDRRRIDTLVLPLVSMLELAYRNEEMTSTEDTLITSVCRYVRQNYAEDLTTETVCREFYCSRSRFSHAFKKETGKGFREYLIAVRIEHARRLLRYSQLSVTEVAFSVGFRDANYFSNVFKKSVGVSPIAYRKA